MFKKVFTKICTEHRQLMSAMEISKMERRLQMLIALILFTPTILASLGTENLQQDKAVLTWGINISVYLLLYIYLELTQEKFSLLRGRILNFGIWINLSAFIPFFFLIAMYQDTISGMPGIIFFIATITIFWFPIILLAILSIEFFATKENPYESK